MKKIAIIPARSGSKGLENKNILKLGDLPLLAHTINAANKSEIFDKVFVSTDSEEYAKIAILYGAEAYPLRSASLSSDESPSSAFLVDILKNNQEYAEFALLQPTSPFRNEIHILECYELFKQKNANSIISVVKSDKSPAIINKLDDTLLMDNFLKTDSKSYRRQNEEFFLPNGAIFFSKSEYYLKYVDFYKENSYAYIMNKKDSIDIDDKYDLLMAKIILSEEER